jgi:hypothetical protein
MDTKKWLVASVAAFVALFVMDWILHGSILAGAYEATKDKGYWLSQEMMHHRAWAIWVGQLVFAGMFALIYAKGCEGKPGLGEGFRYGLYVGFLTAVPRFFIGYAVFPYPANIAVVWLVAGVIESIILGLIVGALYKKPMMPSAAK